MYLHYNYTLKLYFHLYFSSLLSSFHSYAFFLITVSKTNKNGISCHKHVNKNYLKHP